MALSKLRCPECLLAQVYPAEIPTDVQECPACGAIFQWNAVTGMITHFYKEAEDTPSGANFPPSEETSAFPCAAVQQDIEQRMGGSDLPPLEETNGSASEQCNRTSNREWAVQHLDEKIRGLQRYWFRRTFFTVSACVALVLWAHFYLDDPHPPWVLIFVVTPFVALASGFIAARYRPKLRGLFARIKRSIDYKSQQQPAGDRDLDEIATHIRRTNVIRRPLADLKEIESQGHNDRKTAFKKAPSSGLTSPVDEIAIDDKREPSGPGE